MNAKNQGLGPSEPSRMSGAGASVCTRAAYTTKKNKHRCQLGTGVRTRRIFHGGSFGVSGTPPGARRHSPCEASGLEKPGARNHQTIQIRQSVIVRLTGLTVTSRDATVDTVTYSRMSPSAGFTPAGVSGTIWIGDRFHPVVSCCWRRGFYRPCGGLKLMFDQFGFSGGWERRKGRGGK